MTLRTLLMTSLLTSAGWPLAALAQNLTLDPVVLTATKPTPAGTGPATTITADEIEQKQVTSVTDALRDIPGVTAAHRGSLLTSNPNIRGFGGTAHMASDPSVQVTVDGASIDGGRVYQNVTGQVADPALLRAVSVLKGPLASLEYGSGISGGTVAMETINGADLTEGQNGFRFRQLLGANSNGDGWVTSSTLAWQPNEKFDLLLNYSRRGQDRQQDGDGKDIPLDGYNVPSLLLKARYRIDAANTITFSHTDSKSAERDVPYGQNSGSPVFGNVNRDRDGTVTSLAWNHNPANNDLLDLELKYTRSEQVIDIEALVPGSYAEGFEGRYKLETDRITLKNTALFTTGTIAHNLRAGLDWQRQKRDTANYTPSGKFTRFGIFAIDEMDFGNELTVSAGARIDRQKIEGAVKSATGTDSVGPFTTTARTLGVGAEKGLGAGFKVFGSFTYTEGLANLEVFHQRSASRGTFYGDGVQKSRVWEGGLKYASSDLLSAGDRVSAALTLYQTTVWDAVYNVSSSATAETAGFKMRGAELEARYDTAQGLYLRGALTINDNREDAFTTAGGHVWQDYIYTPANHLSLTVGKQWGDFDLAWHMHAAEKVELDRPGTTSEGPGYAVHDVTFRYAPTEGTLAGLTVNAAVENVFDRQYKNNLSYMADPGRNFKISLAKTF